MDPLANASGDGLARDNNSAASKPTSSRSPILPRIASGDTSAVPECINRYGGSILLLAQRFLGNTPDAEDAVQEVFVDLWRYAYRFNRALSSESTFVTMIARRRIIDRRRKLQRQPITDPLPDSLPNREADSSRSVDTADEVQQAAAALATLRPEQQEVLRLSVYHGLTHEEISERTGMPLGTVKTHIRRGLQKVRDMLDQPADEGGHS